MADDNKVEKKTLRDDDIQAEPNGARRGMLAVLGATVLGATSKVLGGCIVSNPQPQVVAQPGTTTVVAGGGGVTDGDSGQWADPAGGGRGRPRGVQTGLTDSDSGQWSDPAGGGRGHFGRGGASGLTDSDGGRWADPVGNGRGTARFSNTGITDGDSGNWSDPVGGGRGRRY